MNTITQEAIDRYRRLAPLYRLYINHHLTLRNPPTKASGKINCFSPAANLTRIYFFALSIQTTAPSPKVLCFTAVPTPTGARILSQSFSGAGCEVATGLLAVPMLCAVPSVFCRIFAALVSAGLIVSVKSAMVACCFEYTENAFTSRIYFSTVILLLSSKIRCS